MNSFIQGNGSILPGEVFVVLNQNPAVLGKHPAHSLKPTRWLYHFRVHTSNKQQTTMKSKKNPQSQVQVGASRNANGQLVPPHARLVIPLTKRNFKLWFPLVVMAEDRLPITADSTNLEVCLRLV
jgi:hypothetical protein